MKIMSRSGMSTVRWVVALGALVLITGCGANVDVEETGTTADPIIGGGNATIGSHPWIAFVINDADGGEFCGGTLITRSWVLTAAHCVDEGPGPKGEVNAGDLTVVLGEHDRSIGGEGGVWEQWRGANSVHIHHQYNSTPPGLDYDIALINLTSPVTVTSRVRPIALGLQNVTSGTGIAAGWGGTAPTQPFDPATAESIILKRATLTIRSRSTCNSALGNIRPLNTREICAGDADGSPTTCFGDSGGPLIRAVGSSYELIGVTTWGTLYCTSYTVFEKVYNHLSWIRGYVPGV